MKEKSVLITGAAGNLGWALAQSAHEKLPEFDLELTDINPAVEQVARGTGATRYTVGDLFNSHGAASADVMGSKADVIIWNAAINLDSNRIPVEARSALREKQNASLQLLIDTLKSGSASDRRLVVIINSIAALFGKQLPFLHQVAIDQNWHYGIMKSEQAKMVEEQRNALFEAGVDVSMVHSGAFCSDFTDPAAAIANNNALGKKRPMRGFMGRDDWQQDKILQPKDMSDAMINMVKKWSESGTVPEKARNWVMLKEGDYAV